jgi:hypothetical protein
MKAEMPPGESGKGHHQGDEGQIPPGESGKGLHQGDEG